MDDHGVHQVRSIELDLLVQLFDQASDVAFFAKDACGRYVAVNDSLVRRHGLKNKADAIGKRPRDFCPGDFGLVPSEQDEKILRTGRPLIDHLEMQWHRPHEPVWCLTTKLPILAPSGEVLGIVGFSRDARSPVESHEIPVEFATALEYFEQHLSEIGTPSALATRSKISLQKLARLTKRLFGLTPSQLITKTRIATASRLLFESTHPISEIALASGFYDPMIYRRDEGIGKANYIANIGVTINGGALKDDSGGPFIYKDEKGFRDISDGTSNTILVGERARANVTNDEVTWLGTPKSIGNGAHGKRCTGSAQYVINPVVQGTASVFSFSSMHVGGANFAFADGSVHFISETIEFGWHRTNRTLWGVFQKLAHREDGLVVGNWE